MLVGLVATAPQTTEAKIVPQSIQVPALEAPRLIVPLVIPEPEPLTPREMVIVEAIRYGVDTQLPLAIVQAESGFEVNAKNANSTASGIAQFLDGTFQRYCIEEYNITDSLAYKNNPKFQAECLVLMLRDGGVEHWAASKGTWKKLLGRSDTLTGGPTK